MAIRDSSTVPEVFLSAPGTVVASGSLIPEVFASLPGTIQVGSVIVEVFKTFGCAGVTPSPLPSAQRRQIRRLRRAPHLSVDQLRQFFSRLQLDVQAGVGLTSGQGSDPLVCLRWSDDGGRTWSNEHFVPAGKVGQYGRRAVWRRLGTSRDRVYEVSVSDPVAWRILDAYLTAEPGSH